MRRVVTYQLIATLVIAVGRGEPTGVQNVADQVAQETRPSQPVIQTVEAPKYVAKPDSNLTRQQHFVPLIPKHPPILYQKQKPTYHKQYNQINGPQKYMKVIPLKAHQRAPISPNVPFYSLKQTLHSYSNTVRPPQLVYSASNGQPLYSNIKIVKSPKFSLPVQTINGIRAYDAKPPKSTTTTSTTTTTTRPKRIKRIWPKHILEKINGTLPKLNSNETLDRFANSTANSTQTTDHQTSASYRQNKYASRSGTITTTTTTTTTQTIPRKYRKVTRKPKVTTTTANSAHFLNMTANDWIPIVPSHYSNGKRGFHHRRHDIGFGPFPNAQTVADKRRMVYLQTYGIVPLKALGSAPKPKITMFRQKKRQLNSNIYSGFSGGVVRRPLASGLKHALVTDLQTAASQPRVVTKIKHHHHHHHHKYIKTVEKKVPFKVEVPKPYPVEKRVPVPVEKIVEKIVEKKVPYPVTVEKKVPYKVEVKVPQPFPVKVIEKEYIPKPYPVVQQVQVPVVKTVEVKVPHPVPYPVHVEKKVPYPVHIKVPVHVDRPVPYPVQVEKKVPVPYPVKMYVPQPYPVEKRVPYPVEVKVKEPYEVIKHVPVKIYVPKPYPVKVPHPVPVHVERKVPYPVEVEKRVPVPVKVYVPHHVPVHVEKKVPVYITKHVPVAVAAAVPLDSHLVDFDGPVSKQNVQVITARPVERVVTSGITVQDNYVTNSPHTVTVHGNGHFTGFSDRGEATPATKI